MKKYIIDRFEGAYAICEDEEKSIIDIPKYKLPLEAQEGDCLVKTEYDTFIIDSERAEIRKEIIREKMKRLFE